MSDQVERRRDRTTRRTALGSVAAATMFASGCLFVQRVVVRRRWLPMTSRGFLTDFRRWGPRIGIVLFPIELVATVLLVVTTRREARRGRPGVAAWAAATTCEGATLALLLVYFGRANSALMSPAFPVDEASAELGRWRRWHAVRTLLAALAAVLSVRGGVVSRREERLSARRRSTIRGR
jgi:hypothetical protein